MKNISQYSRSILLLLGDRKNKVPWLILAFLATSFLEVIGIGFIAPFISLIINPESFIENYKFPFIDLQSFYGESEKLIILLGLLLISVFTIKTLAVILINFLII